MIALKINQINQMVCMALTTQQWLIMLTQEKI